MASRILILLLIALLALPATVALPPVQATPQVQERAPLTLAAKKNKKGKPKFTTVTKTVRQSVTQTFASAGGITIPDSGNATPYPSTINVAGFTNGVITDVNVILTGFSHVWPDDVDILLVPAHLPGQNAIVLSDVGGGTVVASLNLILDDQAAAALPDNDPLASGTFRPTNALHIDGAVDPFPTQAPSGNTLLSVFTNANPNGAWQLFVRDDSSSEVGSIASWALQITAEADVLVQEQVKVKKTKKKGKGRR